MKLCLPNLDFVQIEPVDAISDADESLKEISSSTHASDVEENGGIVSHYFEDC